MVLSVTKTYKPYHMEKLPHCLNMIVVQNDLSTYCTLLSKLFCIALLAIKNALTNQTQKEPIRF